jgi:hypothetical protein
MLPKSTPPVVPYRHDAVSSVVRLSETWTVLAGRVPKGEPFESKGGDVSVEAMLPPENDRILTCGPPKTEAAIPG